MGELGVGMMTEVSVVILTEGLHPSPIQSTLAPLASDKTLVNPSDIPLRSSQIIARVNELPIIFEKIRLNTENVLDAASAKWNFHRYPPGRDGCAVSDG